MNETAPHWTGSATGISARRGPRWLEALRIVAGCIGMGALGVAGLAKAVNLEQFAADLESWTLLPPKLQTIAAMAVPTVELVLAGLWFAGLYPNLARRFAIVCIALWSGAFILQSQLGGVPSCGCFALLVSQHRLNESLPAILLRNAFILLLLLYARPVPWSVGMQVLASSARPATLPCRALRRGFTLIEMILCIALVGLLLMLSLPALSSVRQGARTVQRLADLRTHAAMTASYGGDYQDAFPCIADPSATHTILQTPIGPYLMGYFDARFAWWMGVYDPYYGGDFNSVSFFAPRRHSPGRGEPYWYALGCVARPEFWNLATRTPLGQTAVVRTAEVLFPSNKGVFINWHSAFAGTPDFSGQTLAAVPIEAAFCDSSAKVVASRDFIPPVPSGEGPMGSPYARLSVGIPVVHTVDGVRGRDIK